MVEKTLTKRQFLKLAAVVAGGTSLACLASKVSGYIPEGVQVPGEKSALPAANQAGPIPAAELLDANPPEQPVRLIFIHHSTGQAWLADNHGGLAPALRDNNYFVSDTNYGWGPSFPGGGTIGDRTDIGHWYDWFLSPERDTYLTALFNENGQTFEYSRQAANPGGENDVVVFKSCFPNSAIAGQPDDKPRTGKNPLYSQDAWSNDMTVGNIKGLYVDLLGYFATRLDKLFVVITAPPLVQKATNTKQAANARAVNTWLVQDWLAAYPHKNVAVFDFYNVLTSNAGSPGLNDLGASSGNHHRVINGKIEYVIDQGGNLSVYGSTDEDSHPNAAGDLKASGEFLPLLNGWYRRWKSA